MQKLFKQRIIGGFALLVIPQIGMAVGLTPTGSFSDFSTFVTFLIDSMLGPLVPFFISLGVMYFIWGGVKYFMHADDMRMRDEGRKMMVMGSIAIFVMITFWGFAKLLVSSFGF